MGVGLYYLTVWVNASASSDPDGTLVAYIWDWGDFTALGNGVSTSHTYEYPCVGRQKGYVITLTVVDNFGAIASKSVTVRPTQPPGDPAWVGFTYSQNGLILNVDASPSFDRDGTIVKYTWDWGDGTPDGSGKIASHVYSAVGDYIVRLTVTDNMSLISWMDSPITVTACPLEPVASFVYSVSYLTVTVNASGSYDPDGVITSYTWDWEDGSEYGTGVVATHTYASNHEGRRYGYYLIDLMVTDNSNMFGYCDAVVAVVEPPEPPVAAFTVGITDLQVEVNASSSYDSDGSLVGYSWNFGDGSTASGVVATHAYAASGTYSITLTVTDNDGLMSSISESVTMVQVPMYPVAAFTVNITNLHVEMNGASSYDPDGSLVGFSWDFGDGTGSTGSVTTHDYPESGGYSIALTVTDNSGMKNTSTMTVVVEGSSPPHATFTHSTFGLTVSTNARFSSDDDGTVVGWIWNWGDGGGDSGVIGSHTYASPGEYQVVLTITDNSGLTNSTSRNVTVTYVPPVVSFMEYGLFMAIETFATDSYDPDGTIADYEWTWGDGSTNTHGMSSAHVYSVPGSYTVTLTVTDSTGVNASLMKSFNATATPLPTNSFSTSRKIDGAGIGTTQRNGVIVTAGSIFYSAWEDRRDGRGQIFISKSTDRGATWSVPVRVNPSPYSGASQQNPSLAVGPDGAVYVAWQENRSGGMNVNVYLARTNAGGLSFGAAVRVDDTGIQFSWQESPSVAVNSKGVVLVVWKDDRGGYPRVYCARSVNRGDTFSANFKVDDGVSTTIATGIPSLAVDDVGRFYVVWNDNREGNSNIYMSRSTDNGVTFQSALRVDDTGTATYMQGNPSVSAAGDGFVCVVWRDGRSGLLDIYSAVSTNGGVSFGTNVRVAAASSQTDTVVPKVAVDQWRNVYVIWETINSADSAIRFAMSSDLGVTFQRDTLVSDAPNEVYCTVPQLAVDMQGGVHVLWTDDRNDEGDIQYSFGSFSVSYSRQPGQLLMLSERSPGESFLGAVIREQ